jgi:hypothetical protein
MKVGFGVVICLSAKRMEAFDGSCAVPVDQGLYQ